ncbi:MAG TPA: triose-phosphate isomerase [Candidatus Nanoarchaeia archaeon]|nr:triose-phosphate isomerase [Candidatus Nanoarchaeia archaeon]
MKKLIAANWKMNKNSEESSAFVKELKKLVGDSDNADILICPPFTSISAVSHEIKGSTIKLGAQNMYFEESGAFTGEVSASMLKDAGCEYVILGHSERREIFGEIDEFVNEKIIAALKHGLKPILCVGETWEERSSEQTEDILESQLLKCLREVEEIEKVTIAYEPLWAISKGDPNKKSATKNDAEDSHRFIREVIAGIYGEESSKKVRILYGGSMKPENAKELLEMPNIDGGLVGNASLKPESFAKIIESCK